jgi:hypothetical protein
MVVQSKYWGLDKKYKEGLKKLGLKCFLIFFFGITMLNGTPSFYLLYHIYDAFHGVNNMIWNNVVNDISKIFSRVTGSSVLEN